MKHCIFTVVMPEFDVETAVRKLKEWGYDGAEWRVTTMPSPMPPVPNYWGANRATVDINRLPASAEEARKACDRVGLDIPALATYLTCSDLASAKKGMEAAKIMGASMLRVNVPGYDGRTNYRTAFAKAVEDYAKVESLAKEYRLRANLETHFGNLCPSASAAYRLVSNFDPRHVGVIYDPGNMIYEGFESWRFGVELLGEYLAHVHVKNTSWRIVGARPDRSLIWQPEFAGLRAGVVNWADVIAVLRSCGYNGWLSNEDFLTGISTEEKLRDDLAYLKSFE